MARSNTVTPQDLHRQHKIISDGNHRGGGGQDKNSWLLTPDIDSMSETVRGGPISLTDKGFGLWWISADKP
jgi:hypothetical protein